MSVTRLVEDAIDRIIKVKHPYTIHMDGVNMSYASSYLITHFCSQAS